MVSFQDLGSLLISAYESSLLYDAVMVSKEAKY